MENSFLTISVMNSVPLLGLLLLKSLVFIRASSGIHGGAVQKYKWNAILFPHYAKYI